MNGTTAQTAIEIPAQLREADEAARAALSRRRRLDEQTSTLPAEIERGEQEVARLRSELANMEADAAIAMTSAEQVQAQRRAEALRAQIDPALTELENARRRLEVLESRAADLDDAVAEASQAFEVEIQSFQQALMDAFDVELFEALAPARAVVARLRALNQLDHRCRNFLNAMCVPCPSIQWQLDSVDLRLIGRNLIAVDEPDAEMAAQLAPLNATRVALRAHQKYVPLAVAEAERRKRIPSHHGYTMEPSPPREYR
jgi:hypothetical protein